MTTTLRTALTIAVMAIVLVACGTNQAASPTPTDTPSSPAAPSDAPTETPVPSDQGTAVPSGTLTAADGAVVDGPGVPLSEVLAGDLSEPVLVSGVLWLDEDGTVWMADEVTDASVPTFSEVRVQVANYPTDGPTWDMADADLTGLQEANGIRFYEDTKLYGTITP